MATSLAGQRLREQIGVFMGALTIPQRTPAGAEPVRRDDGVVEFYKHWQVRGAQPDEGLFATYADNDDVIEIGLSERDGRDVRNVLQLTLVLNERGGELNVLSEDRADLNFDADIGPDEAKPLQMALRFFGEVFAGE